MHDTDAPVQLIVDAVSGLFVCGHAGCGKTFTRKDHLIRHSSNHSPTEHRCPKCDKAFKRIDLLQRHRNRNICTGSPQSPHELLSPLYPDREYDRAKRLRVDTGAGAARSIGLAGILANNLPPLASPFRSDLPLPRADPQISPYSFGIPQAAVDNVKDSNGMYRQQAPFDPTEQPLLSPVGVDVISHTQTPLLSSAPLPQESPYPTGPHRSDPYPFPSTLTNAPDFEIGPIQTWAFCNQNAPVPAAWDRPIDAIAMGPPFNQDPQTVDVSLYGSTTTPRLHESAERGRDSIISPGLVHRLTTAYPEMQVSLAWVVDAVESYWTNVAPSFPFIHRGTFDIHEAPSALVAMMAIAGSTHLTPPIQNFAKTVKSIRGELVQECGLAMPVSTLSTFCLCHMYDTFHGTNETLFVAQCMWPIMVTHSRKTGIGVFSPPEMDGLQEEEAWTSWAKDEEIRRTAFCVLLIDTQLSAFWNQHPSRQLSIFAHDIALPCPKNQWDAMTSGEWIRQRNLGNVQSPISPLGGMAFTMANMLMNQTPNGSRGSSPIKSPQKRNRSFHPGLHPNFTVKTVADGYSDCLWRTFAAESSLAFQVDLDHALGIQLILMGLLAIAWDCRTRGGMGLIFKNGTDKWRAHVLNAVINLRAAWENSVQHLPPTVESRDMRDMFGISVVSVLSDIPMLQVAAGATTICGATIRSRQYRDAQRRLRIWASQPDAYTCLWQSARYLRSALLTDWGIYTPWAVYLVTLTHWGYAWSQIPIGSLLTPPSPDYLTTGLRVCEGIMDGQAVPMTLDALGVLDLVALASDRLRTLGQSSHVVLECADLLSGLLGGGVERADSEGVKSEVE